MIICEIRSAFHGRPNEKILVYLLAILLPNTLFIDALSAQEKQEATESGVLIAKSFERYSDVKPVKRADNQQQLANLEQASRKEMKLEQRIRELEVLEPILKAEVLTVTKMAANARTVKERKQATKRIREAENNAIAVIKELRALRRQLEATRAEVMLARKSTDTKTRLDKLESIHSRFLERETASVREPVQIDERPVVVHRESRQKPKIVRRKQAKRVGIIADSGKKARMKPMKTVIDRSEFDDVLESSRSDSDYEKALEKQFTAFLHLLDALATGEVSEEEEEQALEEYEEHRQEIMDSLKEDVQQRP